MVITKVLRMIFMILWISHCLSIRKALGTLTGGYGQLQLFVHGIFPFPCIAEPWLPCYRHSTTSVTTRGQKTLLGFSSLSVSVSRLASWVDDCHWPWSGRKGGHNFWTFDEQHGLCCISIVDLFNRHPTFPYVHWHVEGKNILTLVSNLSWDQTVLDVLEATTLEELFLSLADGEEAAGSSCDVQSTFKRVWVVFLITALSPHHRGGNLKSNLLP